MNKRTAFLSGTGLVSLQPNGAPRADLEAGAPLARHLPRMATARVATAAAVLSFRRMSRAKRAAAAGIFGVPAASGAGRPLFGSA
jgi:hypothetical protein